MAPVETAAALMALAGVVQVTTAGQVAKRSLRARATLLVLVAAVLHALFMISMPFYRSLTLTVQPVGPWPDRAAMAP